MYSSQITGRSTTVIKIITGTSLVTTRADTCKGRSVALIPRTGPSLAKFGNRRAHGDNRETHDDQAHARRGRELRTARTSHSAAKYRTPMPPRKSRVSRVTRAFPHAG